MRNNQLIQKIIDENYEPIFRYCSWKLQGDADAAQDCTQETFRIFLEKLDSLDLKNNITGWLYATVDRVIKKHLRDLENRSKYECDNMEEAYLIPDTFQTLERSSAFQNLTNEEYELIKKYYESDSNEKLQLANQLGISLNTLYQRIHAIKKKVQLPKDDY